MKRRHVTLRHRLFKLKKQTEDVIWELICELNSMEADIAVLEFDEGRREIQSGEADNAVYIEE